MTGVYPHTTRLTGNLYKVEDAFQHPKLELTPNLPTLLRQPPLLGEHGFPLTALTSPVNLAGLPALALPVPAPDGMIASMQVIGTTEERVLAFGRVIEAAVRP